MKTINQFVKFLQGKKTYIISVALILVNALIASGAINPNPKQTLLLNAVLGALGLGALRAGVAKVETPTVK